MAKVNGHTAEQVIEAVRKNKGILTLVARDLRVTRQTVHNYVNRFPTIAKAVEDERNSLLDMAEGKLFEQVQKGNMTAIIFTLKTLGKSRGYIEHIRNELTGAEGSPIVINIRERHED